MKNAENEGEITKSFDEISRMVGASKKECEEAIFTLVKNGICDALIDGEKFNIKCYKSVTCNVFVRKCNGNVTLRNRRMYRDSQRRKNQRLRTQKHRSEKPKNDDCNAACNAKVCDSTNTNTNTNTRKKKKKEEEKRSSLFDKFWSAYPKKISKKACRKIWDRLKPDEQLTKQILDAIEDQKHWRANPEPGEFIPEWKHPTTWLNQGCWEDKHELQKEEPDEQPKQRKIVIDR